eukprot:6198226-Pleurochrysis_carterae.AAC.3
MPTTPINNVTASSRARLPDPKRTSEHTPENKSKLLAKAGQAFQKMTYASAQHREKPQHRTREAEGITSQRNGAAHWSGSKLNRTKPATPVGQ